MKDSFLLALIFLTRFPVPYPSDVDAEKKDRSLLFYPLVGLVIGVLLWIVGTLGDQVSSMLLATLVVISWVLITGGLHLDGLADCADAWAGGGTDRQKTVKIMKDAHVGPMAVVVIVLTLITKVVAVGELLSLSMAFALIVIPMISRCVAILLFMTTPYVSGGGLGQIHDRKLGEADTAREEKKRMISVVATLVFCLFVFGWISLLLIPMVGAVFLFIRQVSIKRLGGFTGDVVGAAIEIIEVVCCLGLVFLA